MKTSKRNTFVAAAVLLAVALPLGASASIIYVDAAEGSSGNTYATGGSLSDTSWYLDNDGGDGTLWNKRTGSANESTVFQAGGEKTQPELTTEITGLADGDYYAWVFFWNNGGGWNIDAGLTSGSLTSYSAKELDNGATTTNGVIDMSTMSTDDFSYSNGGSVLTTESDRTLYGVNLGQVTVSSSAINVFVDHSVDPEGTGFADTRTWYDGVGYEVIPEPASLGLFGIVCAALWFVRRRFRGMAS